MTRQQIDYEKLLFLYSCALEDGDFEAIHHILSQAEHDTQLMTQLREIESVYQAELQSPRTVEMRVPVEVSPIKSANGYVASAAKPINLYPSHQPKPHRGKTLMRIAILILTILGGFFTYLGSYQNDSPVLVTEIPSGQSATMLPQADRVPITTNNVDQLTVLASYGEMRSDNGAVWSNDGSQILVYGTHGITVYETTTYTEIETIPIDGTIRQLVAHPTKTQVAFIYNTNNLAILDLTTHEIMVDIVLIDDWVQELAYSPNGEYLVTVYSEDKTYLWDSQTAEIRMILRNTVLGETWGASFSRDSRYLAMYGRLIKYNSVSSDAPDVPFREVVPGGVIWDVELGVPVGQLYGSQDDLTSLTYSADGQSIVGVDNRGYIYVWDVAEILVGRVNLNNSLDEGYYEATFIEGSHKDFWTNRYGYWLDENDMFITYNYPSNLLELWDIENMEIVSTTLSMTTSPRWRSEFIPSPNEQLFAFRKIDQLQIIDWQAGKQVGEIPMKTNNPWSNVRFSDDSSIVAVNSYNQIAVWDVQAGNELNHYENNTEQQLSLNLMIFMPNSTDTILMGGNAFTGDGILSWNIVTDEIEKIIPRARFPQVLALDVNTDNEMLFIDSGGNLHRLEQDTEHNIWEVHDLYVSGELYASGNLTQALWLNSDKVILKDYRKVMYVVDDETGEVITELTGYIDSITDITLSADKRLLASIDYSGTLIVWDTTTWEQVTKVYNVGELSYAGSVSIASDNRLIAISGDGKVVLWDSQTQTTLATLENTGIVEFSPDRTLLATIKNNGVALWGIPQ